MIMVTKDSIQAGAGELIKEVGGLILESAKDIEGRLSSVPGLTADSYATTIAHAAYHSIKHVLGGSYPHLYPFVDKGRNMLLYMYEYEGEETGLILTIKRLSPNGMPAQSRTRQAEAYLSQRYSPPKGSIPGLIPDNLVLALIGPVIGPDGRQADYVRFSILQSRNSVGLTFAVDLPGDSELAFSDEVAPSGPTGTNSEFVLNEPNTTQHKGIKQ